jgi:type I restriction enzyme, S subunit
VVRAFAWIDRIALETTSARKLVDHLDQAILTKASHGELVPQDPNDEPVNVLLERIRAEREVRLSTRRSSIKKK